MDKYCIHNDLPKLQIGPKNGLRPLGVKDQMPSTQFPHKHALKFMQPNYLMVEYYTIKKSFDKEEEKKGNAILRALHTLLFFKYGRV